MRKILYWIFLTLSVIGFSGFVLLIEALNGISVVCLAVGIIGAVCAYIACPEYIHKTILEEGDEF